MMHSSVDCVTEFVSDCWEQVFAEVRDAAVYIDDTSAECLHWSTAGMGYLALKSAGAVAVHQVGMYHFRYIETKETNKAVLISASGDSAFYRRTIKMILAKNAFESWKILCSAPFVRSANTNLRGPATNGERSFDVEKLEEDVKEWMSLENLAQKPSVSVLYVPIFIAPLSKELFVTPPFGDLMPPMDADVTEKSNIELDCLAGSFLRLFECVTARPDIYPIGRLSEQLAARLERLADVSYNVRQNLSRSSEASSKTGMSVILLDRTLDLCSPTSSNTESFLSKILQTLPRLPGHRNDIAINVLPIVERVEDERRTAHRVPPGCLASTERNTIDSLISKKAKKVLEMANEALNESFKQNPRPRTPSRISGRSLEKLLDKIRTTERLVSTEAADKKLQGILAIVETLTSKKAARIELLTSLEKLAFQSLSVSGESSSILAQLSNVVQTRTNRGLDMEDLLPLLVYVYALAGTEIRFSAQQECRLEESIANAISEDVQTYNSSSLCSSRHSGVPSVYRQALLHLAVAAEDVGNNDDDYGNDRGMPAGKDTPRKMATRIMEVLRATAEQRSALQDYRSLIINSRPGETVRFVGIVEQVTEHLLRTKDATKLRDLCQRSGSLDSSRFNLLPRAKSKQHPCDNPWLLIYILGGITTEEIRMVRELVSRHSSESTRRVTLAGSRLLNPIDVADYLLSSSINK